MIEIEKNGGVVVKALGKRYNFGGNRDRMAAAVAAEMANHIVNVFTTRRPVLYEFKNPYLELVERWRKDAQDETGKASSKGALHAGRAEMAEACADELKDLVNRQQARASMGRLEVSDDLRPGDKAISEDGTVFVIDSVFTLRTSTTSSTTVLFKGGKQTRMRDQLEQDGYRFYRPLVITPSPSLTATWDEMGSKVPTDTGAALRTQLEGVLSHWRGFSNRDVEKLLEDIYNMLDQRPVKVGPISTSHDTTYPKVLVDFLTEIHKWLENDEPTIDIIGMAEDWREAGCPGSAYVLEGEDSGKIAEEAPVPMGVMGVMGVSPSPSNDPDTGFYRAPARQPGEVRLHDAELYDGSGWRDITHVENDLGHFWVDGKQVYQVKDPRVLTQYYYSIPWGNREPLKGGKAALVYKQMKNTRSKHTQEMVKELSGGEEPSAPPPQDEYVYVKMLMPTIEMWESRIKGLEESLQNANSAGKAAMGSEVAVLKDCTSGLRKALKDFSRQPAPVVGIGLLRSMVSTWEGRAKVCDPDYLDRMSEVQAILNNRAMAIRESIQDIQSVIEKAERFDNADGQRAVDQAIKVYTSMRETKRGLLKDLEKSGTGSKEDIRALLEQMRMIDMFLQTLKTHLRGKNPSEEKSVTDLYVPKLEYLIKMLEDRIREEDEDNGNPDVIAAWQWCVYELKDVMRAVKAELKSPDPIPTRATPILLNPDREVSTVVRLILGRFGYWAGRTPKVPGTFWMIMRELREELGWDEKDERITVTITEPLPKRY